MTNPKKTGKKSSQEELDQDNEMTDDNSYDAVDKNEKFEDEDDDFDVPLDDLDTFDDFADDDDDY
jgi:hypothetical protein